VIRDHLRPAIVVTGLAVAAVACRESVATAPTAVPSTCTPRGTTLELTAVNIAFDPSVLCARAGHPFSIAFDNRDAGVPHNVQIFTDRNMSESVFKGALISGVDTVAYSVAALPPGVYWFRCDVHPSQMVGALVVAP